MNITEDQIERAARALREHDMQGRITRKWRELPNADAKKWRMKASIALWAALRPKRHPNGSLKFATDGTMLDEKGKRFDDVDE